MNKKAFTLIELLAVIIIIGVLAVITLPKISDTLENSKKNAAQLSAYGYKKNIDKYILDQKINDNIINLQGEYNITGDGNIYNEENVYNIKFEGKKPKNGILEYNQNELVSGCITIAKYKVDFEDGEVTNTEKGACQYEKILTRKEKLPTKASDYIEAIEDINITQSGIYSVSELNNEITYSDELPTDGWVSIVYDETNGNKVWKYSIKYRENEVISYDSTNQSTSTELKSQPIIILIDGTNGKTTGDEIAIGTEHFYVLENTYNKTTLLAKANLNVGDSKNDNLTEGIQGEVSKQYNVKFSETNYWFNSEATKRPYMKDAYKETHSDYAYIYDPVNYAGAPGEANYSIAYYVNNYVNYLKTQYQMANITGRVLTRWENNDYKENSTLETIIGTSYSWLSTGYCESQDRCNRVYTSDGNQNTVPNILSSVRPVIELSEIVTR